jgi:hypothetical protein
MKTEHPVIRTLAPEFGPTRALGEVQLSGRKAFLPEKKGENMS